MVDLMNEVFRLLPADVKKRMEEEEARRVKLREQMRQECADALSRVADAIRTPNVARNDLDEAQKHLLRAASIAAVLDPE